MDSGDIGISADCDYSAQVVNLLPTSYSGNCTYRDSEGKELMISGDEMLQAINAWCQAGGGLCGPCGPFG